MLKATSGTAVLTAFLCGASPARADTLRTGAIRDRGGAVVAGARVSVLDRSGRVVGRDVAIADGTFALDVPDSAATVEVDCDYCRSVRLPIGASDAPLVIIVARFTAVTQSGPSPSDIGALPYRSAADVASLRPFTVVSAGRISDRGLGEYGATLVNGLSFYSPFDGDNYSRLVPARAIAALSTASPLVAPIYGGYASAGIYDVQLSNPDVDTSRLDAGNAFDLVARADTDRAAVLYADANDGGDRREAASAAVGLPFAGGHFGFAALDMADDYDNASGAGLAYTTDSLRYATALSADATQTDDSSLVAFGARLRKRGPLALEFGLRATRATSDTAGYASAQADAALYADTTHTSGALTLSADAAYDTGSSAGDGGSTRAGALIGSIGNDLRLSANWSIHSGVVSNLRIPTFTETSAAAPTAVPGVRSLLFEQSITYTDRRRLRLTGSAYTQRTTEAETAHVYGVGIDAGWQIAPQFALQTWLLRANESATQVAAGGPPFYDGTTTAGPLTRQLVWLTYDNGLRFDALVRGGALEGDVRFPFGAAYALALSTAKYNGVRVTTIGITRR
jgi:hypothetical protein